MKTSELRSITDYGWKYIKVVENRLMIYDGTDNTFMGSISTTEVQDFTVSTNCDKNTCQAIIDYAYTPLEEREEEKKYYLVFPKGFSSVKTYLYKSYGDYKGTYSTNAYNEKGAKTQFTQKEIDEMPFDTNFFEKVEVE